MMTANIVKVRLEDVAIIMNPESDHAAIAREDIPSGTLLEFQGEIIEIRSFITKAHRFALRDIREGEYVSQYGYPFGQSKGISRGEAITASNINNILPEANLKDFREPDETTYQPRYMERTFAGYVRKDGRVGTRNFYLVIPTSMCASETAFQVAQQIEQDEEILRQYPNMDGIVAIPHTEGCGCDSTLQIERLMRVLQGYINHPNVGGCLIMDLGCEKTNYDRMFPYIGSTTHQSLKPVDWLTIQDNGGAHASIERGKEIIASRLWEVNENRRTPSPLAALLVGTECGASDSFSGITANPLIGSTVDKIISAKGSAILSEIPEMAGTFSILWPRFRSEDIASKYKGLIDWYAEIANRLGLSIEDNLVPKNIEGGLINNYLKSLGAILKGGATTIEDVLDYAEPVKKRGLSIMQGPGNDLESVTGIVASGATIICFSTGYGTPTGNAICPVIKVASTEDTFRRMPEDMDFNAGRLLNEKGGFDELSEELLEMVIAVASGRRTWSEIWRQRQFQVWTAGKLSV